jgi:peptide/nickel transport system ATP-binding protein
MLAVQHLSVAFRRYDGVVRQRRLTCLNDVSMTAKRGELVAIIGASGAGKSLLAHAIVGILPANAEVGGRMSFDGQALTTERQASIRGRRIGLVPQSIAFLDPLARVARQIERAARRAGIVRSHVGEIVANRIRQFGLDADVGRAYPHELSGGMARRVLLAIATIGNPDLVIADEPTTGLDDDNAAAVLRHLRAIADNDKAALLITHDIRAAVKVAHRVVVIRDGVSLENATARAFCGSGEELATDYSRALWQALPENQFSSTPLDEQARG